MIYLFLKKTSLLLGVIICLSLCFEAFISMQLAKGKRYYIQADWHDLKNHNSNILFIGNSRTWLHVNPFLIQKKLNTRCEIIAQHGQDAHVVWLKFKEYTKFNSPPKEIYLQFDPFFLTPTKNLFGIHNFRTCFFNNRVDLTSLKDYNGYSSFYNSIPLAAIDFELFLKIITNDTVKKQESYENSHGSQMRERTWEQKWNNPPIRQFNISDISQYVDSFIVYSKTNQIHLYALYSPQSITSYRKTVNINMMDSILQTLSSNHNYPVAYINYNENPIFHDSSLFYEHIHLNKKGVNLFTKTLLNDTLAFKSFKVRFNSE